MPGVRQSAWYFLVRPKMYTISGTLGEIVAFIQGYVSSPGKHHGSFPIEPEWYDFREWLEQKLEVTDGFVFHAFAQRYGNDEAAAKELFAFFERFQSAKAAGWKSSTDQ